MLFSCLQCGKEISLYAPYCPSCGHPTADTRKRALFYGIHMVDGFVVAVPSVWESPHPADCSEAEWNEFVQQATLIKEFFALCARESDPEAPRTLISHYFHSVYRTPKPIPFSDLDKKKR